jgi:hypothetical protein
VNSRHFARLAIFVFLALVAIFTPRPSMLAQPSAYIARVTSVVVWKLSDAEFQAITPEVRAALERDGTKIVDQDQTLQSRELPLVGYWLEFPELGTRRFQTDKEGYLRVPAKPTVTTDVKVFEEALDTDTFAVLSAITFVPEGETPPASVLRLRYQMPPNMSPPDQAPPVEQAAADTGRTAGPLRLFANLLADTAVTMPLSTTAQPPPTRCPPIICDPKLKSATKGCCLDYDGPMTDGKRYKDKPPACGQLKVQNFLGSTCYKWTFDATRKPCLNEGAIWLVEGPACFINHKFRYCQMMDESDFRGGAAPPTIKFNETTRINVRNRTSSNVSTLRFIERPQKTAVLAASGPTKLIPWSDEDGYTLEHFDATRHYEDASVTFKAPAKPVGEKCSEIYKILMTGGTHLIADPEGTVAIRVKRSPCGYEFTGLRVEWETQARVDHGWRTLATQSVEFSGRVCGDPSTSIWWLKERISGSPVGRSNAPIADTRNEVPWKMTPSGVLVPGAAPVSLVRIELKFVPGGNGQLRLHVDPADWASSDSAYFRSKPSDPTATIQLTPREELAACEEDR